VEVDLNKQGRSAAGADGEEGDGEETAEEVDTPWFVPALGSGVALAVVATLVWAVLQFYLTAGKENDLAQLEQSITDKKSQLEAMTKQQDELASLKQKKLVLERIVKHGTPRVAAMQILRANIPEGVRLTSMRLNDASVTAGCTSVDFTKASHYAINLQGSNLLDDVHISDLHRLKKFPQLVGFAVDANVRPELAAMKVDINGSDPAKIAAAGAHNIKVLMFFDGKEAGINQLKNALTQIAEKYPSISVQQVEVGDAANKALVDKYQVKKGPELYIVDNAGTTVEHIPRIDVASLTAALDRASKLAQTSTTK
jgi:Tfp pilus assembly protein PilN